MITMVYWVSINELTGYRIKADTLDEARKIARTHLHNKHLSRDPFMVLPKSYGTKAITGVPIYKTLSGKKEVGFVIGLDAYYWVVYDKKYGSASYSIRKDGSINKY